MFYLKLKDEFTISEKKGKELSAGGLTTDVQAFPDKPEKG